MEVITRHFINKCKSKARYLKPPPRNVIGKKPFLCGVSSLFLDSGLQIVLTDFLETSWFFSPQSLPYDKDPQGCRAQWKKDPWCGWQLQAPASFYYCDGRAVAGRTLVLNPHDVIANLQAKNSNIGSILVHRCAELNSRVLRSENPMVMNILYCFKDLIAAGCPWLSKIKS